MKLALRLILCFFIAFSTASAAFAAPSIRDQLLENGQTREDILDYFAARYGKQIRYDPPVDPWTAALWVVPAALFSGLLLTALFLILRRKKENH